MRDSHGDTHAEGPTRPRPRLADRRDAAGRAAAAGAWRAAAAVDRPAAPERPQPAQGLRRRRSWPSSPNSIRQQGPAAADHRPPRSRSAAATRSSPASAAGARRRRPACTRCRSSCASSRDQEAAEFALIENVQRTDLNAIEEATGYSELIERFGYTQEQVSEVIGKSRSHLANTLRLLKLPAAGAGAAAGRQADRRPRARSDRSRRCRALAQRIVEEDLNVRDVEALVQDEDRRRRRQRQVGGGAARGQGCRHRAPSRRICRMRSASRSRSSAAPARAAPHHQVRQLRPARLHPRPPHRPAGALIASVGLRLA